MVRPILLVGFSVFLGWSLSEKVSAQIVVPNFPQPGLGKLQKEQLEQLQKALDALNQPGVPPGFRGNPAFGGLTWGGMRLAKVEKSMQEDLGLPENEGLRVASVDANSAAEKAGLKQNDILVKLNNKPVPSDFDSFGKLVKGQKVDDPLDIVVVRDGKEEMVKGAKMPAVVQINPAGGRFGRPGIGGIGGIGFPRIQIGRVARNGARNLSIDMNINGERIVRKENGDSFSGEYQKEELKITVQGKFENGLAKPGEIAVTNGKETKKYTEVKDVPQQYRPMLQRIMPSPAGDLLPVLPMIPEFPDFPAIPGFPGFEDQ